jgi:hypothetical protein
MKLALLGEKILLGVRFYTTHTTWFCSIRYHQVVQSYAVYSAASCEDSLGLEGLHLLMQIEGPGRQVYLQPIMKKRLFTWHCHFGGSKHLSRSALESPSPHPMQGCALEHSWHNLLYRYNTYSTYYTCVLAVSSTCISQPTPGVSRQDKCMRIIIIMQPIQAVSSTCVRFLVLLYKRV